MPFAAGIIGFKPASLPPVARGAKGVIIGHIQSGHWADRAGLRAGDTITHINGAAVSSMETAQEFIDALSPRPLRVVVEIGVSPGEVTDVFRSFDWSARMSDVNKVRSHGQEDSTKASEMFERVFDPSVSGKSSLFDISSWLPKSGAPPPPPIAATPQEVPTAVEASDKLKENVKQTDISVKIVPQKNSTKTTTMKWIPSYPICLWYKVDQGYAIPQRAGTLGLDYLLQPFSSEPMVELSLIFAPPQVTLENLLAAKPIEPSSKATTSICDASYVWNASGSLVLSSKDFTLNDLMILGKLQDYRRLEEAKTMGVFAIRLNTVEISDTISNASSSLVTLTSSEPLSFDLTNTKIKLAFCLKGSSIETVNTKSDQASSKANTPIPRSSVSSSVGTPEIKELGEDDSPKTLVSVAPQAQTTLEKTPFQRAYRRAVSNIREGDTAPIKMQHLNIR